jgi:hypothetical protein
MGRCGTCLSASVDLRSSLGGGRRAGHVGAGQGAAHDPGALPVPLEAYARLGDGDRLRLEKDAACAWLYFENGRQETWSGPGDWN